MLPVFAHDILHAGPWALGVLDTGGVGCVINVQSGGNFFAAPRRLAIAACVLIAAAVSIKLARPQIYYGELARDYCFADTRQNEFDYPSDASDARNNDGRLRVGMMTENRVMEQQPVLASETALPPIRIDGYARR